MSDAQQSSSPPRWLVVGAGSFGTAMVHILGMRDIDVTLAARTTAQAEAISRDRSNEQYFPGVLLPDDLTVTTIAEATSHEWDLAVLAVPTSAIAETLQLFDHAAPTFLSLAKGLAPDGRRLSELAAEIVAAERYVVLSGPNIAWELIRDMPAAAVLAGADMERAAAIQTALSGFPFRVYLNDDLLGVELAGALKNVVAIAAGVCQEAGVGMNALAAVMTRGMGEIARLGITMGARPETFLGLAGIGDLITTIGSEHSRNRRAGRLLAEGVPAAEIPERIGQVVEGLRVAPVVAELGRTHGVQMNVCSAVAQMATGESGLSDVLVELMSRPAGWEFSEDASRW